MHSIPRIEENHRRTSEGAEFSPVTFFPSALLCDLCGLCGLCAASSQRPSASLSDLCAVHLSSPLRPSAASARFISPRLCGLCVPSAAFPSASLSVLCAVSSLRPSATSARPYPLRPLRGLPLCVTLRPLRGFLSSPYFTRFSPASSSPFSFAAGS